VAATGGHLSELFELYGRLPTLQQEAFWFVPASEQSRTLLQGHEVAAAPDVRPRDVGALPAAFRAADHLLRTNDVDCVVSTGSGVAIAAFAAARARGIACHYIESAARVDGPSLTGRLLQGVPGVHLWSQHTWTRPGRWVTAPSVFDGFAPRERPTPPQEILRVVVTLGTMRYGFRRLVEHLLLALPAGADVLWQTGATDVSDLDIDAQPFVSPAALATLVAQADVVLAHAGVGSALTALNGGVCPVLVARRRMHREHVDDHQVQVAAALAGRGLALAVDPEQLTPEVLLDAARLGAARVTGHHDDLVLHRSRRW